MKIIHNYSPNFEIKKRKSNQIKFIIFHYTGMKRESEAIKKLTNIKLSQSTNNPNKNIDNIVFTKLIIENLSRKRIKKLLNGKAINKIKCQYKEKNLSIVLGHNGFKTNIRHSNIEMLLNDEMIIISL